MGLPPLNNHTNDDNGWDLDFWWPLESYAGEWILKQEELKTTQESSHDLSVPLDMFAKITADAQNEWDRLFNEDPQVEDKLAAEFGIRFSELEL